MNLTGKIAVVTGAGGGMGSILARKLKELGCGLVLIEKELSLLDHLADLFDGPQTVKYASDFSSQESVEKLVEVIKNNHEKIDFLYHVAGVGIYKDLSDLSPAEWKLSLEINLNAPFILTKGLLPLLSRSQKSMIFTFGSGVGRIPLAGRVAYCASKFGLRGMSLSLAKEYKDKNIDFVLLTLGSVMTGFGTGGLTLRKKLEKEGKKYFTPEEVIEKVIKITKAGNRKAEYVLYPEDYAKKQN